MDTASTATRADAGLPGSLPDDYILTLFCDQEGRLWAGTNAGGLALYDEAHDRFISHSAGPHGLSHVRVEALADDGRGGVWVGIDGGLDRLDPATETVEQIHHREGDPESLMNNLVTALLHDRSGTLWVGTSKGLRRSTDDGRSFLPVPLEIPGHEVPIIRSLMADSGVDVVDPVRGHVDAFRPDASHPETALPQSMVSVLESGAEGRVYVGPIAASSGSIHRRARCGMFRWPAQIRRRTSGHCFGMGIVSGLARSTVSGRSTKVLRAVQIPK